MPEQPDYPADDHAPLPFLPEPGGKRPESAKSLAARVECLERARDCSDNEIESLKSELAILVRTVDELGKQTRRHIAWAPRQVSTERSRFLTASAGVVIGVALGLLGWALWSRATTLDTIDTIVAAAEPAAEELPVELPSLTPAPTQTPTQTQTQAPTRATVSLAAAITPPVTRPASAIAEERPGPAPALVGYVGTLSIDAAPAGQVFIDRQPAGQTPLRVQNLKAGSHLVWIEREGYRRFTRVVLVPADRVSRVFADLEPIPER